MSTVINEYLFTIRGHPTLFNRSMFFGELHATERGVCPFSYTGVYLLDGLARLSADQPDNRHPTEIVTPDFLESLAVENDRQREAALCKARNTARKCSRKRRPTPTSISIDADEAVLYGYFATDAQRTELWQTAYLLYHELAESGNYTPDKLAATAHWDDEICHYWMEHVREKFALLRRLMSGDFSIEASSLSNLIGLGSEYFNLPPKPGGEPVIAIPAITAELPFEVEESEFESNADSQLDHDSEEAQMDEVDNAENGMETGEKVEQMSLF